ncbi:MAG: D-alanyl-D-alanine carboxypeptidase family protein [Candidatus Merdivicinus sp.]
MRKYFCVGAACLWMMLYLFWYPSPVIAADLPEISAKSAVVMEAVTGRVILEHNADERLPMASTTKIMTALLTLEQSGLDTPFCVDSDAIRVEGSSMGLVEGAEVTLRTLAAGMLLASGNDAANAAAVRIAGSIPDFAILMNQRAAELGMKDTNFETPSGLDSQSHYTTAKDLALLARAALENEDFRALCSQKSMKLSYGNPPQERWLENHNRLLTEYDGCIGVKTGFTKKAGRCLVSAAERNGIRLICVTLNDPDDWNDHKALLDAGFSGTALAGQKPEQISIPVVGGEADTVIAGVGEFSEPAVRTEELSQLSISIEVEPFVYAPVGVGQQLGRACWMLDGKEIYSLPLTAQQDVDAVLPKENWFCRIWRELLLGLFQ